MTRRTPLRPRPTRMTGLALGLIGLTSFIVALVASAALISLNARPVLAIAAMLLTVVGLMMAFAETG
jgi:hypothetical protein